MSNESQLEIKSSEGETFHACMVTPESKIPFPAIVLAQEIFGINDNMRWTAHRYAKAGFLVIVPDLFWRIAPGLDLSPSDPQQRARAMEINNQFDVQRGLSDCRQSIRAIRGRAECAGRVGTVGYCLGGRLAFLLAAQESVDAAVCFYPVAVQRELGGLRASRTPLLVHLAADDALCGTDAQLEIKSFVEGESANHVETYDGVGHGFARMGRVGAAAAAAERAELMTMRFLHNHLETPALNT